MTSSHLIRQLLGSIALVTLCACAAKKPVLPESPAPEDTQVPTQTSETTPEDRSLNESPTSTDPASNPATPPISKEITTPWPTARQEPSLTVPSKSESVAPVTTSPPTQPDLPELLNIQATGKTGNLQNRELTETSGFVASKDWPGVIYAINDSGNTASLYALSESGIHLGQWPIAGRNRDWEDLASISLGSKNYVVIGDTGDNLNVHKSNTLYFVREPVPDSDSSETLKPHWVVKFIYEDGPRNVEAFAIHNRTVYLISKERVTAAGTQASRLYSLEIPESQPKNTLTARFLTQLPQPRPSLEAKLAASLVGVDLNHPTALDFDANGRSAYLLTYREVRRYDRLKGQSWTEAFQAPGKRIHFHQLGQAEALTLVAGRAVFITSEKRAAPLWAIPVKAHQ